MTTADAAAAPLDLWVCDRGPRTSRWTVVAHPAFLEVHDHAGTLRVSPQATDRHVTIRHRMLRRPVLEVTHPNRPAPVVLRGITRRDAARLARTMELLSQRSLAATDLAALAAWHERVDATIYEARTQLRWVSVELVDELVAARPVTGHALAQLMVPPLWGTLAPRERAALTAPADRVRKLADEANVHIRAATLHTHREFFDAVERTPLTTEQADAVLTFDNRVHVVAAAGSGKTSVMVGRAAYAVARGWIQPERILLLAFNRPAAEELQARVTARFEALGLPSAGVRASTFHAFGLDVIGQATGKRPSVAPWVDQGKDLEHLGQIVERLRASRPEFAVSWDVFRLLFARVTDDWDAPTVPDSYDKAARRTGLGTYSGHVVRSEGERLIADWLYLNHVDFEYERPYAHDTASRTHRQYSPDFYYPHSGTWHEHWALDAHGRPPRSWSGYGESMRWKRELHAERGTDLIETTWAGVMDRSDFTHLARELDARGITRHWDPQRPVTGPAPVKDEDLVRLLWTFMTHVKSNSLTRADIEARLGDGRLVNRSRARLFLDLYWPVHDAWQQDLADAGCVDFEDMLVRAADLLDGATTDTGSPAPTASDRVRRESGFDAGFDLVLVDEFQDASQARARMARALVARPHRYLLAVGDDWQSINRFAGADLGVLTRFQQFFGPGPSVHLTRTFRCHEQVAQTAARFVSRNPAQLTKGVSSARTGPQPGHATGVQLRRVPAVEDVPRAVAETLSELHDRARAAGVTRKDPWTVFVLGRYQFDRQLLAGQAGPLLRVEFRTVHSSKGLEADYVVVPNLSAGTFGFPSQIVDDPVLRLAMTEPDTFSYAEERRLLYVALTRARFGVVLLAPAGTPSPFVVELVAAGDVDLHPSDAAPATQGVCPVCGNGFLVSRTGPYGPFMGCSTFPRCTYSSAAPAGPSSTTPHPGHPAVPR